MLAHILLLPATINRKLTNRDRSNQPNDENTLRYHFPFPQLGIIIGIIPSQLFNNEN